MVLKEDREIDLFVGSKIGSFKHVKYHTDTSKNSKKCIENLVDIKSLQKEDGITCMEWGNKDQTEILLGKKNQQIQLFDTIDGLKASYTADFAPGHVVGLGRCRRKLVTAVSSGVVKIWSKKSELMVQTGKLDAMRLCADDETLFATGGEENDLKIFTIGESEPSFSAKNLAHDWLQLRQPVWVTDLTFLPGEGGRLVAVCSRHGYVRLYDSRAQRRPVMCVDFTKMAATCITPFKERQVVVGFGRGQIHQVDLRRSRPDKGYKGCVGAVTALCAARGCLVSTSLDRHLRVHDVETKKLLYKQYLTSKLTRVLVQKTCNTPLRNQPQEVKEEGEETVKVETDELDQLFEEMESISETSKNTKSSRDEVGSDNIPAKKIKPSSEGSTEVTEDAIVKLLRSTEKSKRIREKKKREKKEKSVFHNA